MEKSNDENSEQDEKNDEEPIVLHNKIVGIEAIKSVQTLLAHSARTKSPGTTNLQKSRTCI